MIQQGVFPVPFDSISVKQRYEADLFRSDDELLDMIMNHDVIMFELMDSFLVRYKGMITADSRALYLAEEAFRAGKTVLFAVREPDDYVMQRSALFGSGLFVSERDAENAMVRRTGEMRGWPQLLQRYRGRKILYFCYGFEKEYIYAAGFGADACFLGNLRKDQLYGRLGIGEKENSREELMKQITEADVISFDVFDTLLQRTILFPQDVFSLLKLRYPAEIVNMRTAYMYKHPLYSLDQIYEAVKEACGSVAEQMKSDELALEKRIVRRSGLFEVLKEAYRRGKKIVLTSDMYYSQEQYAEILNSAGISGIPEMYISCVNGRMKRNGLFELVKRDHPGMQILHIGDDIDTDILQAERAGIRSWYIQSAREKALISIPEELWKRCLLGIYLYRKYRDPFLTARVSTEEILCDYQVLYPELRMQAGMAECREYTEGILQGEVRR